MSLRLISALLMTPGATDYYWCCEVLVCCVQLFAIPFLHANEAGLVLWYVKT